MSSIAAIKKRYADEVTTENCGCANLWPYLNIVEGMSILDLGCGNGSQTALMAQKTGAQGEAYGLDITPKMLDSARTKYSYPNIYFQQGSIEKLPFTDKKFDLVTSNCVINHARNKAQVFLEIARVLKTGGVFLIGDALAIDEIPQQYANDPKCIAECWAGAIPRAQYLRNIEKAGFQQIEVLSSREYRKQGVMLESVIIKGVRL